MPARINRRISLLLLLALLVALVPSNPGQAQAGKLSTHPARSQTIPSVVANARTAPANPIKSNEPFPVIPISSSDLLNVPSSPEVISVGQDVTVTITVAESGAGCGQEPSRVLCPCLMVPRRYPARSRALSGNSQELARGQ